MPFLIVLGENGSWRYRDVRYRSGIHEVSNDVARAARDTGIKMLVVRDEIPPLAARHEGPLSLQEVREGAHDGIALLADLVLVDDVPESTRAVEDVLGEFPCGCGAAFPSQAALDRHKEFNHPDEHVGKKE